MEKRIEDLLEGDNDPYCGGIIKTLVMKGDGFIVYLGEDNGICWSTDVYEDFPDDFGMISNRVKGLENLAENVFKGDELANVKYLLAQGFARVLDDKTSINANPVLDDVEKTIHEHGRQLLKIKYIVSSFVTTLAAGFSLIVLWVFRSKIVLILNQPAFEIMLASLAGGIGAFISSFIRTNNFRSDIRVPRSTYYLDGFLRIFYGVVAGFLASLAIKSNVILGIINDLDDKNLAVLCFISTVAGASESLIPSIIKKVETSL